jgi:hypothetical protein
VSPTSRYLRRSATLLGVLALLLQALGPLILAAEARAATASSALHTLELCTADGLVSVEIPATTPVPDEPGPLHADHQHCLACLGAHVGKLLPIAIFAIAAPIAAISLPPAPEHTAAIRHAPSAAYHSRAPPFES